MDEVFSVYALGLVCASVCTNLSIEDAAKRLNLEHPTGISSRWAKADEAFSDGSPNPHSCEKDSRLQHYLFHC